ncbi:hypothetical protein KDM41_07970 [bacterium]|nr:hypothetical protein [bacterium]
MRHILCEDHGFGRLTPVADSVPTWEIRCGMFNLRERVELATGHGAGAFLCRALLAPLVTAPGWAPLADEPSDRTMWWSGRLAPDVALVRRLAAQGDRDWIWRDAQGLLAAALPAALGAELAASWRAWEADAWSGAVWELPAAVANLPGPPDAPAAAPLDWIWNLVPATAAAVTGDLAAVGPAAHARHPFGIIGEPAGAWTQASGLTRDTPAGVHVRGDHGLWLGSGGVELAPGTHVDTRNGPVVLDSGVRVGPHVALEGPLYVGRESRIKAGATVYGESSFGVGNRLAGEIGESTFGDFANKQHDGFIGHAVLGSWVNLGAMTTCSDLKNNYGEVRVDLGDGLCDTGERFVGLLMGDHAKTAIGTLFNTGTVVGFATNIFGGGMPPKHVPAFRWGGAAGCPPYAAERAAATGEIVLGRRSCRWTPDHARLFAFLAARAGA